MHFLSVYRDYNPRRMFGENKKVWIYQCNKWLVFWLITALVTSQLFFKTSKFISVLWWGQFPGYWICDAVPFPYSGHFMLIKDPQRLRKMSSFDLLNKRLHLSGHVMSIIISSPFLLNYLYDYIETKAWLNFLNARRLVVYS